MEDLRTLFIGRGNLAPAYYRCILPAEYIGADWICVQGEPPALEIITGGLKGNLVSGPLDWEDTLEEYDVFVIQQGHGPAWEQTIQALMATDKMVLYEIDDFIHAIPDMPDHLNRLTFTQERISSYERCMEMVDAVICSTSPLAYAYAEFNNTFFCHNGIDPGRFDYTRPEREHVAFGWSGGTGHRLAAAPWLKEMAKVMNRNHHTAFVSIGEPLAEPFVKQLPHRANVIPFLPIENHPGAMMNFDISLGPAGRNNFFAAKSDLRWLESSALGIPFIGDPFVYHEIDHNVDGLVADTPELAGQYMEELCNDAEARQRLGDAARARILSERTMEHMAPQWAGVLAEVAARGFDG